MQQVNDVLFEVIDSTQTHAKDKYEELYKDKITFIRALHQTAGRGQYDRKWECQSKKNIMTTLIYPNFTNFAYLKNITTIIGLTIVQIYQELYDLKGQIKWVNDIILNEKKCGGILVESESTGHQIVLFVGIGLNVNWSIEGATSIEHQLKKEVDQEILFVKLKEKVLENLQALNEKGFKHFQNSINEVLYKKGQECEFVDSKSLETAYIAKIEEVNDEGNLVVRGDDGLARIVLPNLRIKF